MRILTISLVLALAFPSETQAQAVPLDESGFTEYVATLLRKEVGDAAVVIRGSLTLGLGELQANLDRVFAFCRRERASCVLELDRYVKGAAEVHKDRTALPQRDALRVIVRSAEYVQAAQANVGGKDAEIQPRQFVDGLVSLPVLDTPRTVRMLGSKDNTRLGLSAAEVYDLGLENVRASLKPLMDVAKVAGPGQIGQIVGDTYHPSRLLLHDTWEPLANAQGGKLIVALPATDALFYVGEDTAQAIEALRALVRNVQGRVPNRLSDVLLRWTADGWVVVR
jgi:uncharacterized protein YtpQ (UPF0354 family)